MASFSVFEGEMGLNPINVILIIHFDLYLLIWDHAGQGDMEPEDM